MEKNEKKQEQKNRVVEAMLRAREKEMQQGTPEEELPSLSPGEYEDMYQKILGRLKAEGLMDEEPGRMPGKKTTPDRLSAGSRRSTGRPPSI